MTGEQLLRNVEVDERVVADPSPPVGLDGQEEGGQDDRRVGDERRPPRPLWAGGAHRAAAFGDTAPIPVQDSLGHELRLSLRGRDITSGPGWSARDTPFARIAPWPRRGLWERRRANSPSL